MMSIASVAIVQGMIIKHLGKDVYDAFCQIWINILLIYVHIAQFLFFLVHICFFPLLIAIFRSSFAAL